MDWTFGIALLIGFAPVFIMMDMVLKNYTYPRVENPFFQDKSFFGLFTVGIVLGVVMYILIRVFALLDSPLAILYMIIMAVIQIMGMMVVMNLRRFRGKSDSIFYGYGVGLGMAGGMATGFAYTLCMLATSTEGEVVDLPAIAFYIISLSVSLTLILGACGTNVGEGIARHIPMQFVMQAAIPLIAYNMLLAVMWSSEGIMFYILPIAMILLGAFYFRKCLFINLPTIVREVLKMNGQKRDDIPKSK
ncbi:MAG: hypothetical protein J5813_01690 [Candidatus Methanomethylophilaceae archaeon]|nr:hypothetical protein [Candidatus Methanomethylophilaceae archaeon]